MTSGVKDKNRKKVLNAQQSLQKYRGSYSVNHTKQKEWTQFVYGDQWKDDIKQKMESIGHAPISFNYIISCVQQGIAFLSANHPSFSVTGRDDSDTKTGKMFADFMRYIWYISDGEIQHRQFLNSYYVKGVGHFHVFEDLNDDYGRGELKFKHENNWDIYVDPSSKHPLYDDAKEIFVTRIVTKEEFINNFPEFKQHIEEANNSEFTNIPSSDIYSDNVQFEDDIAGIDNDTYEFVMRYYKFREPYYHFTDSINDSEDIMSVEEWEAEWANKPIFYIAFGEQIQTFNTPEEFSLAIEQLQMQNLQFEYDVSTYQNFVEQGIFQIYPYNELRIKQFCYIGDVFLYEKTLPISYYPVIPAFAIHNNTPMPISDVSISLPVQEFINKMMSLVVAHTQATTTLKLLVPRGSVDDLAEIEKKWMMPYAVIEVDMEYGSPTVAQSPPLNGAILSLIQMAKHLIEYQFGIFESQMGNGDVAPNTYKGTLAIDEFGQRRIKSKLQTIESSLTRLGQVMMTWAQDFYTDNKVFRIIQPDNTVVKGEINGITYDDFGGVIGKFNDITTGKVDVRVLGGSTLPVNRFAEWETYKEAYSLQLIDQEEALKKSEIFDKEGVMERMSVINQLSSQLQQATEEIKKLEGDLQTASRETIHSKKQVEVEKFKTKLNDIVANLRKDETVAEKSIEYNVNKVLDSLEMEVEKIKLDEQMKVKSQG